MENNKGAKARNFLQKMFNFRFKVDRKGKPIINVSSIFGLACLIFAPHMTIAGIILSLVLGYQIRFESEDDDGEIEARIRKAAENVKSGVSGAARSIQKEINRMTTEKQTAPKEQPEQAAQPAQPAENNEELLKDLQAKAEVQSNPAATTFHSAYAASAGSVPVLRVNEDAGAPEAPSAPATKGNAE